MMHTAHLAASNAIPLEDWWTAGTAPLLVVQGLDDRGAPPSNGHALRAQLGERVQLVDIPQAGHFLILERPQAIAEAVLAFLRAH
jgi:pimeloyl-ACP methyl ester carboxylesterase